jgi:hypothetical protein
MTLLRPSPRLMRLIPSLAVINIMVGRVGFEPTWSRIKSPVHLPLCHRPIYHILMSSNEYMRRYMLNRYYKRREEALNLLGRSCSRCGRTDRLHLDHIDPESKAISLADSFGVSDARWLIEIRKCQVLCAWCHGTKTAVENRRQPRAHGNYAMYRHGGCRCALCREANAEVSRQRRRKS